MKKLLIVEDNNDYRNLLSEAFLAEGYDVDHTDTPVEGLQKVALTKYDAIISDLNLPIMSGVMFTEAAKNISPRTVCVILTGNPDENSELKSIENNIDLYIEKTKSMAVIITYIDRLVEEKKMSAEDERILTSKNENIVMNLNKHEVLKNGELVDLAPKEFKILQIFLSNKNKVITREDLVDQAWEEPSELVDVRLVDSHIKKVRDKLQSLAIMTVRGYGYRWNEVE